MLNRSTRYLFNITSKYNHLFRPIINIIPKQLSKRIKSLRENSYINYLQTNEITTNQNRKLIYKKNKYINEFIDDKLNHGVNIIGPANLKTGIGEHLRFVARTFEFQKINFAIINYDYGSMHENDDLSIEHLKKDEYLYNVNIFCLSSDKLIEFVQNQDVKVFQNRYNIHYGAWELSAYPNQWLSIMNMVDEIWAISTFNQKAISEKSSLPVVHMPLPIDFQIPTYFNRKYFNLPQGKYLFIYSFDMASSIYRKNPFAVIKAFQIAFDKHENDVGIVIKVNNIRRIKKLKNQYKELLSFVQNDHRIFLIDNMLKRQEFLGLVYQCDTYISLHRSEGFGLGMAEAMKMGKPVIATNYSGNTDFMNQDNSCLVDYTLIPVRDEEYLHGKGQMWAEPNVQHAAYFMKKLFHNQAYHSSIGIKAKKHMDVNYNFNTISNNYINRLKLMSLI